MASSDAATLPFVRPYNASTDDEAVLQVFRQTCDDALKTEPLWTLSSYLWARPYFFLRPQTCFVLDSGAGTAVGYCIGTSSTPAFADEWSARFVPSLDPAEFPAAAADGSAPPCPSWEEDRPGALRWMVRHPHDAMHGHFATLWQGWPGHLHIDVLPPWQAQGWGRKLMDTFLAAVRAEGCAGVHLGMVATNHAAARFYERYGFRRFPEILDDGRSGELGRTGETRGNVIFQVIDL